MRQLARGLAYMHANEVLHRDIAPKNVLFRVVPKTVALCDFGVSRHIGDETLTVGGEHFGSLLYISPQQRADPHTVTEADDVYSLGQVFAYIMTGHEPDAAASGNLRETARKGYAPNVVRLVERMCARWRAQRPRDGREVAAELP
jgi:serine/threonine-protein kinase PpkA